MTKGAVRQYGRRSVLSVYYDKICLKFTSHGVMQILSKFCHNKHLTPTLLPHSQHLRGHVTSSVTWPFDSPYAISC